MNIVEKLGIPCDLEVLRMRIEQLSKLPASCWGEAPAEFWSPAGETDLISCEPVTVRAVTAADTHLQLTCWKLQGGNTDLSDFYVSVSSSWSVCSRHIMGCKQAPVK